MAIPGTTASNKVSVRVFLFMALLAYVHCSRAGRQPGQTGPVFSLVIIAYHATGVADFLLSGSKLCTGFVSGKADLRRVSAQKPAAAIDREFPAVRITDCLKTGVNTAGNPERVSPVNHHTERAAHWSRDGRCRRATRCLAVLRNPQEGGWPGDNLFTRCGGAAGSAFTRSRETVNPGNRDESRLIHS